MGGYITQYPYFREKEYPCFFEDPDFETDMYVVDSLDPLETESRELATKVIDFDCYMSGGRIDLESETWTFCIHDDEAPCNFVYYDANGNE